MPESVAFVTVGTTQFSELINVVLEDDVLLELMKIGITTLRVQTGAGSFSEENGQKLKAQNKLHGISVEHYQYKPSIIADISSAKVRAASRLMNPPLKLVIAHGGAGTCLECLKLGKPLIVVVNENLMDNHQLELATALAEKKHLLFCIPRTVIDAVSNPLLFNLLSFDPPSQKKVAGFVNRRMGLE